MTDIEGWIVVSTHDDALTDEVIASRKLIDRLRRWVSDHPVDVDHPCHCGLCTALRRYDNEVGT